MHDKFINLNPLLLFIAAEWYKGDVMELIEVATATGGDPNISDAYTLNGQPGYPNNCSIGMKFFLN